MNNSTIEYLMANTAQLMALNQHYINTISTLTGKSKQDIANEIETLKATILLDLQNSEQK